MPGTVSDRGFRHAEPISSEYGGEIRVYESSAADGPHLWVRTKCPEDLNKPDGPQIEAVAHLALHDALWLASQIISLAANHYQLEGKDDD